MTDGKGREQEQTQAIGMQLVKSEVINQLREQGKELEELAQQVVAVTIETPKQYEEAVQMVKKLKEFEGFCEQRIRPGIQLADALHAWILQLLKDLIGPAAKNRELLDSAATHWYIEQEEKRQKAEAEERERQRIKRQQEEQERQRKQKELQDQELEAAKNQRSMAADRAKALGEPELAKEIRKQPLSVDAADVTLEPAPPASPAVIQREVPKVAGRSYRKGKWTYRIVDKGLIPRNYLEAGIEEMKPGDPRDKAIKAAVQSLGEAAGIPGIEVYREKPKAITRTK